MIKFILILVCIKLGYSYPEDAPNSACTSMMLHHDVVPKQCQPKYIIQSDTSEYDINDIIRITVRGSTNIDYFKGILLIAVNQNSQHIIGTWSTTNSSIKTISCDGTKNAAITDSSADNKLQIEALWHAPSILSEDKTIIKAAIVTSYDEIYVDCFTITLTPKQVLRIPSVATDTGRSILTKTKTNITWHYTEDTVTVTVAAGHMNIREWIAIGFSLDQEMGDEYVFICQVPSTGIASLRRMHTKAGKRPPTASEVAVNVIDAKYDNGFVTCHFSFETTSEQANNESAPIVIEKDYHLTFAGGILRTDEQVAKHNFTFVSSKTYQLQNAETIIFDDSDTNITDNNNTLSNSTGSSLTTTTTASPTNDVGVNVSWTYANGITTVKMVINNLKISQWFAMGISLDDFMGEDHVFICQHLSNNTISLQRFINPGGHSRPIPASTMADPGGSFNVTLQKLENGITYCDFTLSNFVDISRQSRQNNIPKLSQTSRYRPLIAIGNMDSSNVILRHAHDSRIPLKRDVFLNRQETITYNVHSTGSDSTGLMKAHGIIMIFTWIVLVSTGILIARYFKLSWSNKKICNKAVWFAIHRAIMTCVAILTLIAFVLILVYKKGQWVPQHTKIEFVHSIFGIFVISFSVIQPFMALFRCNPDAHYRFIFNYAHATVGFSALTFSIVAIFLAMFFTELNFQLKKEWAILVVWLCWLPIIFIIFEVIEIYFPKFSPSIENGNSIAMYDQLGSNTTKTETISVVKPRKKDRIKLFALLLHILIAIGLALALMILIGRS